MFLLHSYAAAVVFCLVTMLCWGSWANTQKLVKKSSSFQLFYWDYSIGVFILALIAAFTLGSTGHEGRGFLADLAGAHSHNLWYAFIGGILFNIANILLVLAIDIAGMSVAFPVAIGLGLVLGVISNYILAPIGSITFLAIGVILVICAMLFSAKAYASLKKAQHQQSKKGMMIAVIAGLLMGFFYPFVAASMAKNYAMPAPGMLTPYTALVIFSVGILVSNLVLNTWMMKKPMIGEPVTYKQYFQQRFLTHFIGILGGAIWSLGILCNLLAAEKAGYAISYGLGQGATMIAAFWGVFIWKEFKGADKKVNTLLALMFLCYLLGLIAIVVSRFW
jgi:glucose uptake protein